MCESNKQTMEKKKETTDTVLGISTNKKDMCFNAENKIIEKPVFSGLKKSDNNSSISNTKTKETDFSSGEKTYCVKSKGFKEGDIVSSIHFNRGLILETYEDSADVKLLNSTEFEKGNAIARGVSFSDLEKSKSPFRVGDLVYYMSKERGETKQVIVENAFIKEEKQIIEFFDGEDIKQCTSDDLLFISNDKEPYVEINVREAFERMENGLSVYVEHCYEKKKMKVNYLDDLRKYSIVNFKDLVSLKYFVLNLY